MLAAPPFDGHYRTVGRIICSRTLQVTPRLQPWRLWAADNSGRHHPQVDVRGVKANLPSEGKIMCRQQIPQTCLVMAEIGGSCRLQVRVPHLEGAALGSIEDLQDHVYDPPSYTPCRQRPRHRGNCDIPARYISPT
jgi:hypothetical protein